MRKPVKIRYEQQPGRGAALFIGQVYFDDGSKQKIADCHKQLAGLDLPIEHDGLPEPIEKALVSFPRVPQQTTPSAPKAARKPAQPLWPWKP